jgi:hypothetical protein
MLMSPAIHHIEDINVKFALQNYVTAGAVFAAYFAKQTSIRMAAAVVVGLGVVFTLAIFFNIVRYRLFWKMHRIARDHWLAGQAALRDAYFKDADCRSYLSLSVLPRGALWPVVVINLLPAAAAVLLWWRRS